MKGKLEKWRMQSVPPQNTSAWIINPVPQVQAEVSGVSNSLSSEWVIRNLVTLSVSEMFPLKAYAELRLDINQNDGKPIASSIVDN